MSKIIDLEVLGNFKERQDAVNEDKFLKRSNVTADGNEVKIVTTEADSDQGISEVSYTALTTDSSLSASKITGVLDISNIPPSAQERVVTVANATARKALTTNDVQKGDVVKETDTGLMYFVVDDTKLNQDAGYTAFAAGIASSADTVKLTPTRADSYYALVFADACAMSSATTKGLAVASHSSTSTHCPIRVNPGVNNSTAQGTATLSLGNNINNGTAYNKQGRIALYGTNTGYTIIQPGYNSTSSVTLTLPSSTGTIALTSSNITGSSASCTGNAATATSAAACTGNSATATTATNANNVKVTHSGAAWRDILAVGDGFTSASNQAVYGINNGSVAYYVDANATSGNQRAIFRLGNATANTTAAGHNGLIWMYGTSTGYTEIIPGYNSTSSITLTLPSATGTIALTSSNITGSSASCTGNAATATTATKLGTATKGSATQPIYLNAGAPTACTYTISKSVPSDAKFTDTTYSAFVKSGSSAAAGLVPKPATTAGTTKFLCEDATWKTIPASSLPDADYIVAQSISYADNSVSGYRKWNSGLLEKWGQKTESADANTQETISFNSTVAFVKKPVVYITKGYTESYVYNIAYFTVFLTPSDITTTSFKIYIQGNSLPLKYMSYYAVGNWK